MIVVNIHDAKAQLSKLIEEAAAGNDVVIARGGKPIARLTRLGSSKRKIIFGVLKGKRQTASTYLHKLESIGVLEQKQIGLDRLFLNGRFLKLLTQESNDYKRFALK
jgi:prevent-host-death family protein